jgi:hypothetical protein
MAISYDDWPPEKNRSDHWHIVLGISMLLALIGWRAWLFLVVIR